MLANFQLEYSRMYLYRNGWENTDKLQNAFEKQKKWLEYWYQQKDITITYEATKGSILCYPI